MNEPTSPRMRILLVDDCPDGCAALAMLLREWGHEVRTAGDGPTGLTAAEGYQPHLILLDVGLPGMDGYEVARRLRDRSRASALPWMVTLSGFDREEDFDRSRSSGCEHHLVKPVNLCDLRCLLAGYAEQIGPWEQEVLIT